MPDPYMLQRTPLSPWDKRNYQDPRTPLMPREEMSPLIAPGKESMNIQTPNEESFDTIPKIAQPSGPRRPLGAAPSPRFRF